jgi:nicotinamidase-related amidase
MTIGWVTTEQHAPELGLRRDGAGLLVIDWQERLAAAMDAEVQAAKLRNVVILCRAAARLGLPIVVSEQYPKGLGPTVAPVLEALPAGDSVRRFEKMTFSCAPAPELKQALAAFRRDQWIVCGMETHVCVYQTVRDLCWGGGDLVVHVVADAVQSRRKADWEIGLDLMRQAGAVLTCTETVVFDLLQRAGTEEFKELSKLVK